LQLYHHDMRTWLLILMIAVAPLRGWAGDVMSVAMATEQLIAHGSPSGSGPANAVHADCVGHSGDATEATGDSGAAEDDHVAGHCPTCSACQVCSSAALTVQTSSSPPIAMPHAVPTIGGTHFTSVAPALGFKPPIS
jgi:hypothetical protein